MRPAVLDYARARTLDDALDWLGSSDGQAKVFAGGQSLGPMLNLRLARPAKLIDIRHIPQLRAIEADSRIFSLGATWTHAEIEDGMIEDPTRGLLPFVARGIAYRAVRNRGTIGGSLSHADPAADWVSTMAAIGAIIEIRSAKASARSVAAHDFLRGAFTPQLAADDIVCAVHIPRFSPDMRWGYYKVCRKTGEFAKAIGACVVDPRLDICRVVAGALHGRPLLLPRTTASLRQDGPDKATALVRDEIDDMLATLDVAHRQQLAVAVERSLAQLNAPRRS
ncbi:FAD binding domain-containing protein [Bradyrhizobium sp. BRP22]|uniref:FAD binding domain-containing protein n=1 Tax=Bradyrhizobium sp. BRP22 TaxID=2793821 RepID=UPI001CD1DB17|nr:FAD binding domain-containing protein [Bradyrhizobium sp. BRP22]MCA1453580.1 FAD binding domain-containing protein [Bradyrhizobium sp. BRP22]